MTEVDHSEPVSQNVNVDISKDETYKNLNEKFLKIRSIQKNDKTNAEVGPIWHASEMKTLLDSLLSDLNNILNTVSSSEGNYQRILAMKCAVIHEEAKMLLQFGAQDKAQESLASAMDCVGKNFMAAEFTFLALRISNHYAFVLSKQQDLSKPQMILEQALSVYKVLKNQSQSPALFTVDDLFFPAAVVEPKTETMDKLEKLVTNNYQMLAYIYNKQGKYDDFALVQHIVLKRQLPLKDGEAMAWALKAARVAGYFLTKGWFRDARHHLAAATHVMERYEDELKNLLGEKGQDARWEELQRRFTDIAKFWVKYGLVLFSMSKTQMMSQFYGDQSEFLANMWAPPAFESVPVPDPVSENQCKEGETVLPTQQDVKENIDHNDSPKDETPETDQPIENVSETKEESTSNDKNLCFTQLDVSKIEDLVLASLVETTEQARKLFLYTHAWLNRSKTYYNPRDHPNEYVNCILDLSELYRYLAFYEEDIDSQYSVQKRRADALETLTSILREVKPRCYHAVSIELLRELAEIQLEMLSLNLRRIYVVADNPVEEQTDKNTQGKETQSSLTETQSQEASRIALKIEALTDIHNRLSNFSDSLTTSTSPAQPSLESISYFS